MAIEVGSVVYLRTTDEPCLVLNILGGLQESKLFADIDSTKFSGQVAIVRRPVLTEQGILHRNDTFLIEELESRQDKEQRIFNETETLRAQMFPKSVSIVEHKN